MVETRGFEPLTPCVQIRISVDSRQATRRRQGAKPRLPPTFSLRRYLPLARALSRWFPLVSVGYGTRKAREERAGDKGALLASVAEGASSSPDGVEGASNAEIERVAAISGDTMTITRTQTPANPRRGHREAAEDFPTVRQSMSFPCRSSRAVRSKRPRRNSGGSGYY